MPVCSTVGGLREILKKIPDHIPVDCGDGEEVGVDIFYNRHTGKVESVRLFDLNFYTKEEIDEFIRE